MKGYRVQEVGKAEVAPLLNRYHYLGGKFKVGVNYGLVDPSGEVVGVCIFTVFPVPELAVGMLGLGRDEQEGLIELSRLVLHPREQVQGRNAASWFVGRALRLLRKHHRPRVVLSYADSDYHGGTVYQACNFKYYGTTDPKKDFWELKPDGSHAKVSRGSVKNRAGEWRPRSQKHRYAIVYDKKLRVRWEEKPYPKKEQNHERI